MLPLAKAIVCPSGPELASLETMLPSRCRGPSNVGTTQRGPSAVRQFVGEELQSDVPTKLHILCFIDHTHPAAADPAEDAVMGNGLPYGLGRSGQLLLGIERDVNRRAALPSFHSPARRHGSELNGLAGKPQHPTHCEN